MIILQKHCFSKVFIFLGILDESPKTTFKTEPPSTSIKPKIVGGAWSYTPIYPRYPDHPYPNHPSSLPYKYNDMDDVEVFKDVGIDDGLVDTSDQQYGRDVDFFGSDEVLGTPPSKSGCEILEVGI